MVDFVRPNFLGSRSEFSNMFERPIMNGQCVDSTTNDIRLMRFRAHVLHSLLEGFVQRSVISASAALLPNNFIIFSSSLHSSSHIFTFSNSIPFGFVLFLFVELIMVHKSHIQNVLNILKIYI